MQFSGARRSDLIQQSSRSHEICRIFSLSEPAADRCQDVPCSRVVSLLAPELGEAHRTPHFPDLRPLLARARQAGPQQIGDLLPIIRANAATEARTPDSPPAWTTH